MTREALLAVLLLAAPLGAFAAADEPTYSTIITIPAGDPGFLVVIFKGINHRAADWLPVLDEIAARGHIGVGLDYADFDADRAADDAVVFAGALYADYPTLHTGIVVGVSGGMPGATLALANQGEKPAGGPQFDYLLNLEGVTNLIETYAEATGAAAAVEAAAPARDNIEAECGSPADAQCLAARSAVLRAPEFAAKGLKGVWSIQAVNDGLVPYNQGLEFNAALAASGIPFDHTTVVRGDYSDDKDTAATEYVTGPATLPDVDLAGHASEDHLPHTLVNTTLNTLWAVFAGYIPGTNGLSVMDRELAIP